MKSNSLGMTFTCIIFWTIQTVKEAAGWAKDQIKWCNMYIGMHVIRQYIPYIPKCILTLSNSIQHGSPIIMKCLTNNSWQHQILKHKVLILDSSKAQHNGRDKLTQNQQHRDMYSEQQSIDMNINTTCNQWYIWQVSGCSYTNDLG